MRLAVVPPPIVVILLFLLQLFVVAATLFIVVWQHMEAVASRCTTCSYCCRYLLIYL